MNDSLFDNVHRRPRISYSTLALIMAGAVLVGYLLGPGLTAAGNGVTLVTKNITTVADELNQVNQYLERDERRELQRRRQHR